MTTTLATVPQAMNSLKENANKASTAWGDLTLSLSFSLGMGVVELPTAGNDAPSAIAGFVETLGVLAGVFERAAEMASSMICPAVNRTVPIPTEMIDGDAIPAAIENRMGIDDAVMPSESDHDAEGDQIALAVTPAPEVNSDDDNPPVGTAQTNGHKPGKRRSRGG